MINERRFIMGAFKPAGNVNALWDAIKNNTASKMKNNMYGGQGAAPSYPESPQGVDVASPLRMSPTSFFSPQDPMPQYPTNGGQAFPNMSIPDMKGQSPQGGFNTDLLAKLARLLGGYLGGSGM